MRIIQTFWTGGRSPKEHSFGWLHPEYNLMSWALSCLSLREHYDEVVLYTDKEGYKVLIEELQLPYTEVHVEYDEHLCLPQHWAYSKIKTYSLQTKPFLHIDGDIYLPKPLPESVMDASLVAQNREIGTGYYRQMVDRMLEYKGICYPDYIEQGIHDTSMPSYNMGIFGGKDLDFIHHYCEEVFRFLNTNHFNNPRSPHSNVNGNVFFEQIFLAMLADHEGREIASVVEGKYKDNGYMVNDFCDLDRYEIKPFFHILGGHKRNDNVVAMFERCMIRVAPEQYRRIASWFPERYPRFCKDVHQKSLFLSAEQSIAQYVDFQTEREKEWSTIPAEEVFRMEVQMARCVEFLNAGEGEQRQFFLESNLYLSLFQVPKNWHPWALEQMKVHFHCDKQCPLTRIAFVPSLKEHGQKDMALSDMGLRIVEMLQKKSLNFGMLQDAIIDSFKINEDMAIKGIQRHVLMEIAYLLKGGIIMIN